jgi:hypothetical protein
MKSLKKDLETLTRQLKAITAKAEKLTKATIQLEKASAAKKTKATAAKTKTAKKAVAKPVKKTVARTTKKTAAVKAKTVDRKKVIKMIIDMRKKDISFEKIARALEAKGIATFSGKGKWRGQTVHKLFKQLKA